MIPEVGFFIRVQLIKATFKPLCKTNASPPGKAERVSGLPAKLMILTGRKWPLPKPEI